jgi:hypothetical protein
MNYHSANPGSALLLRASEFRTEIFSPASIDQFPVTVPMLNEFKDTDPNKFSLHAYQSISTTEWFRKNLSTITDKFKSDCNEVQVSSNARRSNIN